MNDLIDRAFIGASVKFSAACVDLSLVLAHNRTVTSIAKNNNNAR